MFNSNFPTLNRALSLLIVFILFVLMIVITYTIQQLGSTFTAGSSAANASASLLTQVSNNIPIAGLVMTVVFIALVIGALVGVMMRKGGM
jgi:uncharacterized membrane protein